MIPRLSGPWSGLNAPVTRPVAVKTTPTWRKAALRWSRFDLAILSIAQGIHQVIRNSHDFRTRPCRYSIKIIYFQLNHTDNIYMDCLFLVHIIRINEDVNRHCLRSVPD